MDMALQRLVSSRG